FHPHGLGHDQVGSDGRRSGRLHVDVEERVQFAVGRRHGALRIRVPAGQLRAGAHGRRRKISRPDAQYRSLRFTVQGSRFTVLPVEPWTSWTSWTPWTCRTFRT